MNANNKIPEEPARRFLAVRQHAGLTQHEFAESLGVSLRSEQNYERGERKIPANVLLTIARKHGIDPIWIMEGPGFDPKQHAAPEIDIAVVERAQEMVEKVIARSGQKVSEERRREMVAKAYRYYKTGDSEGETDLLATFLRAGS